MSSINPLKHHMLLEEARKLLKDSQTAAEKGPTPLSEEDIFEWIMVFEQDRIMLDGCNHATVKR